MAEGKKLTDMSPEEKQAAFQKWLESKESRQGKAKARREATKAVIAAHKVEYDKAYKAALV